ncbi:hypothetical protein IKO50_03385 [bacterium]|nr:hypothetical protein [bacterium]
MLLYHITVNSSSSHILGIWYQSGQGHCLPVNGLLDESHHQLVSSSQVPHHKLSLRTLLQSESRSSYHAFHITKVLQEYGLFGQYHDVSTLVQDIDIVAFGSEEKP